MKTIRIILIATIIGFTTCKPTLESIKSNNDINSSIGYVVNYINNCIDGSNQVNIDEKAFFDQNFKTLIVFTGKTKEEYIVKHEISLADLNADSIMLDESEMSGNMVTVFTKNKENKIKYYKDGSLDSMNNKFSYYLGFCWKKEKEKQYFVESFRRAIIVSQNH